MEIVSGSYDWYTSRLAELAAKLPGVAEVRIFYDSSDLTECPSLYFIVDGEELDEVEYIDRYPDAAVVVEKLGEVACWFVREYLFDIPDGYTIEHRGVKIVFDLL